MLYHAGLLHVCGGFVGVDVFFVISGFLISRILLADIERGQFSLIRFYVRRIRRIMRAFGFMAIATSLAAVTILTPLDLEQFGKSLIAAALFSFNMWFWQGANYFAASSQTQIILHAWSLAVEDQFCIVWPFVTWVLSKCLTRMCVQLVIAGSLVLLIVSQYAALYMPAAAFYVLLSRHGSSRWVRCWQVGPRTQGWLVVRPRSRVGDGATPGSRCGLHL